MNFGAIKKIKENCQINVNKAIFEHIENEMRLKPMYKEIHLVLFALPLKIK